ncbi:MAG: hypothetical protein CMN28_08440 [Salinisphaeraceae bacterium]|jgi:hypothetical protein|nr:hypothetical protein [Salinisphaeraceae bacterium]
MNRYRIVLIGGLYLVLAGVSAATAGQRGGFYDNSSRYGLHERFGHQGQHPQHHRRGHDGRSRHYRGQRYGQRPYGHYRGQQRGWSGGYGRSYGSGFFQYGGPPAGWQGGQFHYPPHGGYYTRDRRGQLHFHKYR